MKTRMRTELLWTVMDIDGEQWTLVGTERGLCRIIFPHEKLEAFQPWLEAAAPGVQPQEDARFFEQSGIIGRLKRYFSGERISFEGLPLDLIGTEFQEEVWNELARVPYGELRTYGDIAQAINRPRAVRAVGAANGANPIPIILPCHRIVGANRKLTGFRGGLAMKKRLLAIEGIEDWRDEGHARFQF